MSKSVPSDRLRQHFKSSCSCKLTFSWELFFQGQVRKVHSVDNWHTNNHNDYRVRQLPALGVDDEDTGSVPHFVKIKIKPKVKYLKNTIKFEQIIKQLKR